MAIQVVKKEPTVAQIVVYSRKPLVIASTKTAIVRIVASKPQPIKTVVRLLRGERGATNIMAVPPLALDNEDKLSIQSYTFTQTANLASWLIKHDLNQLYPRIVLKNESGESMIAETEAIDVNNIKIIFNQPTTGIAYLYG